MENDRLIYAVDFDGTLCEEVYPDIGKPRLEVIHFVKMLKRDGHRIILWTCRDGDMLDKAVQWCKDYDLDFDAVNDNLPEIKELFKDEIRYPDLCKKIFANYYLDDRSITIDQFLINMRRSIDYES